MKVCKRRVCKGGKNCGKDSNCNPAAGCVSRNALWEKCHEKVAIESTQLQSKASLFYFYLAGIGAKKKKTLNLYKICIALDQDRLYSECSKLFDGNSKQPPKSLRQKGVRLILNTFHIRDR